MKFFIIVSFIFVVTSQYVISQSDCSSPGLIGGVPFNTSNSTCGDGDDYQSGGMTAGGDLCGSSFLADGEDNVWTFTPSVSGSYDISLSNVSDDELAYLSISDGCFGIGNCIASGSGLGSAFASANLNASTTYYITVDHWAFAGSCITYDLSVVNTPPAPSNDDCANAIIANISSPASCDNPTLGSITSSTTS